MRERQKFGHIRRTKRFALSLRSKIRTGALAVLAQLACWMVNSHRGTGKMAKVWNWCVISRFSRSTFTILVRLQRRRKYSQGDLKSSRVFGETQRLKSIKRWKQKKRNRGEAEERKTVQATRMDLSPFINFSSTVSHLIPRNAFWIFRTFAGKEISVDLLKETKIPVSIFHSCERAPFVPVTYYPS